ncbi:MAG: hypothetical protein U0172_02355 [Nitrospiraceae bacterium]
MPSDGVVDATASAVPSREELNAELLPVPEPPEVPDAVDPPGFDDVLAAALRHVKGRRGGDLVAVLLVGSAARRVMTAHSGIDLIAVVKGDDVRDELVRVHDRAIEIRYCGDKIMTNDVKTSPRLPPLLRKARVLFELEGIGGRLIDLANDRFRQGPPRPTIYEQIRLRQDCEHWLGKAEDLHRKPAAAQYMFALFFDQLLAAFFRLRGLWPTAPADAIRFIASRDAAFGALLERFQLAPSYADRLSIGRQLVDALLKDVPLPARVD